MRSEVSTNGNLCVLLPLTAILMLAAAILPNVSGIAYAAEESSAGSNSEGPLVPRCNEMFWNGQVCGEEMTMDDLRLRDTRTENGSETKTYEYVGSDPHRSGAEITITERGNSRIVQVTERTAQPYRETEIQETWWYQDGKQRQFRRRQTDFDPRTREGETRIQNVGLDQEGNVSSIEYYRKDPDGAEWTQEYPVGPNGQYGQPGPWIPQNGVARERQQQMDAQNNPAPATTPERSQDNENTEEPENLPEINELTGLPRAPRTCGEITDPEMAIAMGCVGGGGDGYFDVGTSQYAPCSQYEASSAEDCGETSDLTPRARSEAFPSSANPYNDQSDPRCGSGIGPAMAASIGCTFGDPGSFSVFDEIPTAPSTCGEISDPATALAMGCTGGGEHQFGSEDPFDRPRGGYRWEGADEFEPVIDPGSNVRRGQFEPVIDPGFNVRRVAPYVYDE